MVSVSQFFLHAHAEFLFLVDDEQSEVVPFNGFANQLVRADDDIDFSLFKVLEDGLRLLRRSCAAQIVDPHGEIFEARGKRVVVLQGKHRCWHKHRHLFVVGSRLHGRTHGNLRFSEAHVATHQAVHWAAALHVGLDFLRDAQLVGRILIGKSRLQFVLHKTVVAEGKTLLFASTGIELDEVAGNVLDFLFGSLLEFVPGPRSETAQMWRFALLAFVFRHLVERMDGDKHHIIVLIREFDHLLHRTVGTCHAHQSGKASHSVVDVYNIIARFKLHQFFQRQRHFGVACMVGA